MMVSSNFVLLTAISKHSQVMVITGNGKLQLLADVLNTIIIVMEVLHPVGHTSSLIYIVLKLGFHEKKSNLNINSKITSKLKVSSKLLSIILCN